MTDIRSRFAPPAVVLLVEDDALVRMVAADLIARAGHLPVPTADAAEALAWLARGEVPDVLVTDVRMPGTIDGIALARIVAQRWARVGILVSSAHASPTVDELPPGAIFLPKPYAPAALARHVATLAARRMTAALTVEA